MKAAGFIGDIVWRIREWLSPASPQFEPRSNKTPILNVIFATAVLVVFEPITSYANQTSFEFTSTPGSWVGHGYLNYYVSPGSGWSFTATSSTDLSYVRLRTRSLDPNAPSSNYYWDLDLEMPNGNSFAPGFYPNATRYPFNSASVPGMWLSGNHRGDNVISGYFTVLEVAFATNGTLDRFAVDFRQYDEGNPNNWVDGK